MNFQGDAVKIVDQIILMMQQKYAKHAWILLG